MAGEFDGNYDYTKPWRNNQTDQQGRPKWSYSGPWSSNEERLTQQALMVAIASSDQLRNDVRPNLPQIRLFPDRFGYGDRTQPGIDDIVSVSRQYLEPRMSWKSGGGTSESRLSVEPRVQWNSGGPAGYSGSSRNSLESSN